MLFSFLLKTAAVCLEARRTCPHIYPTTSYSSLLSFSPLWVGGGFHQTFRRSDIIEKRQKKCIVVDPGSPLLGTLGSTIWHWDKAYFPRPLILGSKAKHNLLLDWSRTLWKVMFNLRNTLEFFFQFLVIKWGAQGISCIKSQAFSIIFDFKDLANSHLRK